MLKQVLGWLEIKVQTFFLYKKFRFCILSLKNIAVIPLLQKLPETLRNPLGIYNYMLGKERVKVVQLCKMCKT